VPSELGNFDFRTVIFINSVADEVIVLFKYCEEQNADECYLKLVRPVFYQHIEVVNKCKLKLIKY
jgi:hypothetical protein